MRLYENLLNQLQDEFRRADAAMELISDIDREILSLDRPLDEVLAGISARMCGIVEADTASVLFPVEEELLPADTAGADPQLLESTRGFRNDLMALGPDGCLLVEDQLPDSVEAVCCIPVFAHERILCFLAMAWSQKPKGRFSTAEVAPFGELVSRQLSIMAGRFLDEKLSRLRLGLMSLLFDQKLKPSACWEKIVRRVSTFLPDWSPLRIDPPPKVQLLSYNRGDRYLTIIGTEGDESPGTEVLVDSSICGMLVQEPEVPFICLNPREHRERYRAFLVNGENELPQSELAVPVRHDGELIGVLNLEHAAPGIFRQQHTDSVISAARFLGPPLAALRARYDRQRMKELGILYTMNHLLTRVASTYQHLLGQPLVNMCLTLEELESELCESSTEGVQMLRDLATQLDRIRSSSDRFCEALPRFIRYGPVRVASAIKMGISVFQPKKLEEEQRIAIPVEIGPDVDTVYASELLQEHIYNLVNNSLYAVRRAIADGAIEAGVIGIRAEREEVTDKLGQPTGLALVRICVSDNGTGAPKEVEARIGEPHFTTKPNRHGSGFGVSAAREYAQSVGGDLELENYPNKGFAATLVLEAYDERKHAERSEAGEREEKSPDYRG